jgi:hypothetical protein
MKNRKTKIKWLALFQVFFLATASAAQGLEHCEGKCCQGPRETVVQEPFVVNGPGAPELAPNSKTTLDAFLPSCHLPGPPRDGRTSGSEKAPCQDEGAPISCCHMGKAGTGSQALVSQGHSWGADRFFHALPVICMQPDAFLNENQRNLPVDGGGLQPRAAPVPLYLKNTAFLC